MAITVQDCRLLAYSKSKLNVDFSSIVTLGRMNLYASESEISGAFSKYNLPVDHSLLKKVSQNNYAEPLYALLGAKKIDSMDVSTYENASVIHDMNDRIPENLLEKYTVVLDCGTIEHVFNFPVAIKNSMDMVKTGGHLILVTPANNQMGHGFYQFSPELFFRLFSEDNGFRVCEVFIRVNASWLRVKDPARVRERVELTNSQPTNLIVVAQKVEHKPGLHTPQQSDYVSTWQVEESLKSNGQASASGRMLYWYRKLVPARLRFFIHNVRELWRKQEEDVEDFGKININHYEKVDL